MVAKTVTLLNGVTMTTVGLGVYKAAPGEVTYGAVLSGIQVGYRHIDTAQVYGNEADVGRAVRECGVPRQEIFVTTKVWSNSWGYEKTHKAVKDSAARMGLDYIDLVLLHAPFDPTTRAQTWKALEECNKNGLVRSIGVSNFGIPHIEKLLTTAEIPPMVNQIEAHPYLQRRELVEYCKKKNIVVQAYSPLVKAAKLTDPVIVRLAGEAGVTPSQLLVRWSLQKGMVPLPKSTKRERQANNLDVFSFDLNAKIMGELDALECNMITGWDPITSDPV